MGSVLRVFISSTARDLAEHRSRVLRAILSLDRFPEDMISWPANSDDPVAVSVDKLAASDVLVLILAHRYGHVPEKSEFGITELEYQAALERGIPVLPFVVDSKYPWPIEDVDFENAPKLRRLKEAVKSRHVVASFTTPDSLAAAVVQALIATGDVQHGQRRFRDGIPKLQVRHSSNLRSVPDIFIPLGASEDGLPLVCRVERSKELSALFAESDLRRPDFAKEFPDAAVEELRRALSEPNRLRDVLLANGDTQKLYVSRRTLSELFTSALTSLVRAAYGPGVPGLDQARPVRRRKSPRGRFRNHPGPDGAPSRGMLESYGGLNRFLGVPLDGGRLRCVGRKGNMWAEWREFEAESLCATFPEEYFVIYGSTTFEGRLRDYPETLQRYALDNVKDSGDLVHPIVFKVRRRALFALVADIARATVKYHGSTGKVHGDLKPPNVLLLPTGPRLIDSFSVSPGTASPGFTPGWSAPEEILGHPVAFTTDTYSLAVMVLAVLRGDLIGELSTFRVPPRGGGTTIQILRNPLPYLPSDKDGLTPQGRRAWSDLLSSCLRFEPEQRIECSVLAEAIDGLLLEHDIDGVVSLSLPSSIRAAVYEDGRHAAARIVEDGLVPLVEHFEPEDESEPSKAPASQPAPFREAPPSQLSPFRTRPQ